MVVIRATFVSLCVALAACSVGEVPGGNTPPVDSGGGTPIDGPGTTIDGPPITVDPATSYTMTAKPVFSGAGCLGCHPAQSKPDLSSFDKILPVYLTHPGTGSLLVTKGDHQGIRFLTDDKKKIISDWLDTLP